MTVGKVEFGPPSELFKNVQDIIKHDARKIVTQTYHCYKCGGEIDVSAKGRLEKYFSNGLCDGCIEKHLSLDETSEILKVLGKIAEALEEIRMILNWQRR